MSKKMQGNTFPNEPIQLIFVFTLDSERVRQDSFTIVVKMYIDEFVCNTWLVMGIPFGVRSGATAYVYKTQW